MDDDDFGDMSAEEVVPAKPVKKSLFSKKITVKAAPAREDDEVEFFSRAKDLYRVTAAEQKRRQQKKLVKRERKRSSASAEATLNSPGEKRRRVSSQDNTESSDEKFTKEDVKKKPDSKPVKNTNQGSPTSLSARYNNELRQTHVSEKEVPAKGKGYLSLSDSGSESDKDSAKSSSAGQPTTHPIDQDDEDDPTSSARTGPAPPLIVEDDALESDEEFPELVAAARERARLEALKKARQTTFSRGQNHGGDFDDVFDGDGTNQDEDTIIDVLITSKIENSTPLRVKRKLSQQLKLVKSSWCDRQRFDGQPMTQKLRDEIFLTCNGNKVFDFNTCRSLIDAKGKGSLDGLDEDGDHGIILEAWTPEVFSIWKQRQEEKLRKERIEAGDEEPPAEAPVKKTKLVMKSRDMEYKLVVKPHTTVQKMIQAFRRDKGVPDHRGLTLRLDGDELTPETTVKELDLEDMDNIEVHIH